MPFVSYMALHNDVTHLAVNSLWLLAFGPVVARRFGAGLFLLFFLICGVAGAATYLALNWGSPEPVIGASGAISGLMAAGLRLLPTMRPSPGTEPLLPALSRQVVMFSPGLGRDQYRCRRHRLGLGRRKRRDCLAGASGRLHCRPGAGGTL